jgi:hypothetical protein
MSGLAAASPKLTRRMLLTGIAIVVAALVLIAVGRFERHQEQASVNRHIEEVRAAIRPSLTRPGPDSYLYSPGRSCVLYGAAGRSYGLELCVDPEGRVIEAVDRRGATSHFYSLVDEPRAAQLHISPILINSLINRVKASLIRRTKG